MKEFSDGRNGRIKRQPEQQKTTINPNTVNPLNR